MLFSASCNQENLPNNTVLREPLCNLAGPPASRTRPKGLERLLGRVNEKGGPTNESGERAPYLYFVTVVLALLLIVAVGVAAYFALPALQSHLQSVTEYTPKAGVGLQVILTPDGQLDLSWNRSAPELVNAKSAKLSITDGPLYREVNIDNAQLRSGKLTYFPSSGDVQFRLEIYLDNTRSLAEWVRVLTPGVNASRVDSRITTNSSLPTQLPLQRANQAPLARTPSVEEPDHRASKTPVLKVASPVPFRTPPALSSFRERTAPPDIPLEIEKNPASRLLSLLLAPALPVPVQLTAKIPDHGTNYSPPRTEIHQNANVVQSGSEPAAPMDRKTAEAAQALRAGSLHTPPLKSTITPASRSTPDPSATSIYIPPRPIHKILPNTKFSGLAINYDDLEIQVQVSIDRSGHVTEAHWLQNGKKISSLLTGAAVAAAKQWIFEPAILRGTAVSADHTIVFEFRGRP